MGACIYIFLQYFRTAYAGWSFLKHGKNGHGKRGVERKKNKNINVNRLVVTFVYVNRPFSMLA